MLINLTNHPLDFWSEEQKNTAVALFGEVVDMPFPHIAPQATKEEVSAIADEYLAQILSLKKSQPFVAVHLMGEFCFCFALIERLKKEKIKVVASTSDRNTKVIGNGEKQVIFSFVQFREY